MPTISAPVASFFTALGTSGAATAGTAAAGTAAAGAGTAAAATGAAAAGAGAAAGTGLTTALTAATLGLGLGTGIASALEDGPKLPGLKAPTAGPSEDEVRRARMRSLQAQRGRTGRASTILSDTAPSTSYSGTSLGG